MTSPHRNLSVNEAAEQFHVAPTTIHNWVKEGFLSLDEHRRVTWESIRHFQSKQAGKVKLQARANKLLKDTHDAEKVAQEVKSLIASDADSLSDRYEALLSESFKNKEGIFYTSETMVNDMMKGLEIDESTSFLDPCCGTGNFLLKALEMGVRPENLYGFDTDPNAVMIARKRIRTMTGVDAPNIVCADFLEVCPQLDRTFDLVFTNPPWGKKLPKKLRMAYAQQVEAGSSADTCSLFLFAILSVLQPEGIMGLLMPESFYNIAVYEDARKAVLGKTILSIKDYGKPFKNMFSAVAIVIQNKEREKDHSVKCHDHFRSQESFLEVPRCNLNYWTTEEEMETIAMLMRQPYLSLKDHATWGLGIVTGNNAKRCKRSKRTGLKPVYRGKDLLPGRLKAASLFINPKEFPLYQQMAPLELYQAPQKLIYRFISNKLVFVCDSQQRYILNSANMLVLDRDFPLTSRQLAEIMNSPLTNWLFRQWFHTHKVLRGDLELLPIFPDLSLHRRFDVLDLHR